MPPQSRFPRHPIRLLRRELNLSRAEFARLIGISPETIVSLENDRFQITPRIARRISFITGLRYAELIKGVEGRLLSNNGAPYKGSEFRKRWRRHNKLSSDAAGVLASRLSKQIASALRKGRKNGLRMYCDIIEAIEAASE